MKKRTIKSVNTFPLEGFETLRAESISGGYNFLNRLQNDWQDGSNCFALTGEGFYAVFNQVELVAVGGINIDPYTPSQTAGRLRRFYVKKSYRGQKIGQQLLQHILAQHAHFFEEIVLYTGEEAASEFYVRNGFEKVVGRSNVSHKLRGSQA